MKRPLAVLGASALVVMLAAVRLPAAFVYLGAGVLAAAFALVLVFGRRWAPLAPRRGTVLLALFGGAAALLWLGVYGAVVVAPAQVFADGETHAVTARVLENEPGYGGDTVHATLEVLTLDGGAVGHSFRVKAYGLEEAAAGDVVALELRFKAYGAGATRLQNYAKGQYIGASARSAAQVVGQSHSFLTRMRSLQYAASENVRGRLPLRLSSVAAAMGLGDKRFLPQDTKDAYRAAGLSHMLVVSGLHLSMLCGGLYVLLARLFKNRRVAPVGCIVFLALFMPFTGLSTSIIRCGVVYLIIYVGQMLGRRADVYSSLGLAALVMLAANPYAANDTGLLLSFSATLGALEGGRITRRMRLNAMETRPHAGWLRRFGRSVGETVLVSLLVSLATLPVLVYAGFSVSLLSVPMNVICVPLLAPIVVCSLVMALPPALPVLGWLGVPAAVVGGALLAFLEKLTEWCGGFSGSQVPVGGLFGLVVVLVVYLLVFAAGKTRRLAFVLAAALVLPLALGLHVGLDKNTVKFSVAGTDANSSLVVTSGGQAVVFYRGRQSINAVERILKENRATDCALVVDLRRTAESTEYTDRLAPAAVVVANDLLAGQVLAPIAGVTVYVDRQVNGNFACVEVEGYKMGLAAGAVDLGIYAAPLDVLLAGGGVVSGTYGTLLVCGDVPDWAAPVEGLIQNEGDAMVWLRPGKSVTYKEVRYGAA